jgi:hypothetical protein
MPILDAHRTWIVKHKTSGIEAKAMFGPVLLTLLVIPLETHYEIVATFDLIAQSAKPLVAAVGP